jgi:uncharacterized membrane protein YuzA (DUF378 family)
MKQIYVNKWIYLIAIVLVIIGGLNWGLVGVLNFDLVKSIRMPMVSKIIYMIIAVSAIYLALDRSTYLPFLGDTVYPCGGLVDKIPDNATVSLTVKVPPNAKVVYWASEKSSGSENPWEAYANYENSGVVTADHTGTAVLKIREPTQYQTPIGRKLDKHIHYRHCIVPGMLSPVQTVQLNE